MKYRCWSKLASNLCRHRSLNHLGATLSYLPLLHFGSSFLDALLGKDRFKRLLSHDVHQFPVTWNERERWLVSGRCLTIYALYANEVFDNITSDWTKCNAVNTVNKTPDVKCDWIILPCRSQFKGMN